MTVKLKNKVLLAFVALAAIVLLVFGYGLWVFRGLESRMEVVNDTYVPALKALNQVESSFFLLESDLDKSLQEGILRPKDSIESVLRSRLDFLQKITKNEERAVFSEKVYALAQSYQACSDVLADVYRNWTTRESREADLSAKRADFRLQLKSLIRDVDQEMRFASAKVQGELGRVGIALTVVLCFCVILAAGFSYWLANSLRPLEVLVQVMRNISQKGLDEKIVGQLADLPSSGDELGTLSRESLTMAVSLLDKGKALQDQKQNLQRAHRELASQNEELKSTQAKLLHSEKLGLVGRMAAQMAHEIRNPLNALNLHAELLEDQLRSKHMDLSGLEPLRKEINRLITVTESYLDLSRGPRIERATVSLNEIVEELQDLYQPLLQEKGIFFTCDLGDLPSLSIDRSQFSQVLGNLVKNASEAFENSASGAHYIRLITYYSEEKREVTVTVMDNGSGIPFEQQKNIFSPFFTSKAQGTGLGLTFSRQVIEAHGGEISFDSAPNQGTKFTLRLPIAATMKKEAIQWKDTELRS